MVGYNQPKIPLTDTDSKVKIVDSSTKLAVSMQQNFDIGLYPQNWHTSIIPALYSHNAHPLQDVYRDRHLSLNGLSPH
jgi:hypothetical protein